ncbi:MAG: hypothetical protein U5L45_18720 [Saprospiraceae bacterium]|nr:hypothetical protein [Saprospiraceae bacterium]
MVRFSASPKNEPHSPPSLERSEREMQKTLLGYAHSSFTQFGENISLDTEGYFLFSKLRKKQW